MSNIITTTGRSVGTVTAEIVAISNQAAQVAYMSMIEIGRRLVEVKAMVPHGEWGDYLKNEVQFSQRSANNFMRAYERSQSGTNSQTFANLSYSQISKLLALPDEELEEFTESHDVQNMSVRELDQALKERNEEKRLREEAEAKAAASNASAEKLQKKVDRLEKKLKNAETAEQLAQKRVQDLQEHPQITDAMKEELIAGAMAQAERDIRAELQGDIDSAQAAAQQATEELNALRGQVEAANKSAQMSNPDVMAINLLGKQILEDFNRLEGYRMRAVSRDPELEPKIQAYMKRLVEKITEKVEGR